MTPKCAPGTESGRASCAVGRERMCQLMLGLCQLVLVLCQLTGPVTAEEHCSEAGTAGALKAA